MSSIVSKTVDSFLASFFGPSNEISLDDIQGGKDGQMASVAPLIDRLKSPEPMPTVLPCWRKSGVDWYGLAFSEGQLQRLSREIMAFIGPTYSTFRGPRASLDPGDPIEKAVLDFTGGTACRFRGDKGRPGARAILEMLELMAKTWSLRPTMMSVLPRATGSIIREFYMALRAGSREQAEEQLLLLEDGTRIDTLNLLFLRVQMMSELELHEDLMAHPHFPQMMSVRRPPSVTEALLVAVYRTELVSFEEEGDLEGAAAHFRESVFPKYGGLLAVRAGVRSADALKMFMLLAVTDEPPQIDIVEELSSKDAELGESNRYISQLAELARAPSHAEQATYKELSLDDALMTNDYDRAYAIALGEEPSLRRAQALLTCSFELQTIEAEREAIDSFNKLPPDDKRELLGYRSSRMIMRRLSGGPEVHLDSLDSMRSVPGDLLSWMHRLLGDSGWQRSHAVEVARRGVSEWEISEFVQDPGSLEEITELLERTRTQEADQILHDAFPHLLAFLQTDEGWPRQGLREIYTLMLELLVLSSTGGDGDLLVFNDLVVALLTIGTDGNGYEEIVQSVLDLWSVSESLMKLNWLVDLVDLLVVYPCPSEQARLRLLQETASSFSRHHRRIAPQQWSLFKLICDDVNQAAVFDALTSSEEMDEAYRRAEEVSNLHKLGERVVAIYTLAEKAGNRAKEMLERCSPGVKVHVSNDKVGGDRLKRLAKNADIFVVSTSSAKHAATDFIKKNRPDSMPTVYPRGKGSSSIMSAIEELLVD